MNYLMEYQPMGKHCIAKWLLNWLNRLNAVDWNVDKTEYNKDNLTSDE